MAHKLKNRLGLLPSADEMDFGAKKEEGSVCMMSPSVTIHVELHRLLKPSSTFLDCTE